MGCNCGKKPPKVMTTKQAQQIVSQGTQAQSQPKAPQPASK